ncbi:MAG: TMEM165/GDT1 family protein, partial [Elusimicrobia bacterium]|nr:TMEM165/GDT1 family protein [Elusimicrobiota bacterium]
MVIDAKLFVAVFGIIFAAELPDKTAFATVILATRKHPAAVFIGAAVAFAIQCAIAVSFGTALSLLPRQAVRIAAGLLFLGFAAAMWLREESDEEELHLDAERRASFVRTA